MFALETAETSTPYFRINCYEDRQVVLGHMFRLLVLIDEAEKGEAFVKYIRSSVYHSHLN